MCAFGFNLGNLFGGGPNAAENLQNNGGNQPLSAVPIQAQSVNTAAAQPYTNAQLSLLNQLGQQAQGLGGPTQAQQTLQSGLSQTLASQKAAQAGARGNNQNLGLANAQIANQAAGTNVATAGQAAALRAQEQANAQGQAGNLALSGAQQQQQVAEANANLANSQWQTQAANTMAYNQAIAQVTGQQEAQNQSSALDLFVPNLAEGGVVDPEWESHVTPIAGPSGVNQLPSGSTSVSPLSIQSSSSNSARKGGGVPKIPSGGGGDQGTNDPFNTPSAIAAGSQASYDDQSGGMPGGSGSTYYQSSTASAPAGIPSDNDIAGMADGGVVDDEDTQGIAQPNASGTSGGDSGNLSGLSSLIGLLAAKNGEVLKGPKVVLAGEAGPEAFVPLRPDYTPDPNKAKGPGMDKFLAALKAKGYQDSGPSNAPNAPVSPNDSVVDQSPDGSKKLNVGKLAQALASAGADHSKRIDNLESALNALAKKKGKKGV